jgi:hypothetical protein
MKHHSPHYYSFQNHPFWVDENNKIYTDEFFLDKNYEDYYFDNFLDMDAVFGHEDSLFGTKGLPVGHPERSSKSFDMYTKNYGTAIVRVLKTNSLQEQISRIQEVMGLIIEDEQNVKQPVQIYMNGEGSDFAEEYQGEIKKIPVANTIGNEPFKDLSYMKEKGKSYIDALNNGEEWMNKPIVAIVHPYNSSKYVVVDGNHRLYAYKETNTPEVNAIIVPHKDVVLMKSEWGNENQESINLTDVLDNKEIVDMYFVKPDGTHNFQFEEMTEGELTERCWKGYTQKGMKTMFGKRYPNCVKKTKK